MKPIAIEGQLRAEVGKKSTKAARKNGKVPCVLYGGEKNIHFETEVTSLKSLIYTADFHKVELQIDGSTYPSIIKNMQFHPVTDALTHLDFMELVPEKKISTELPVRLVGLPRGVKEGGKLLLKVRHLKVKALPEDLVPEILVNVEHLDVGKSVRVGEVELPGIEFSHAPAIPIASVEITRALRSAASQEGEEGEGIEGEGEGGEGTETGEE